MSPEQARGDTLDPRSDLYSCGVVFYRLVTGRAPFSSESFVGLLMKHINDSPPPPITIAPAISEAVNAVIEKSLAKNPNDRFQDARAMRNAVMACMAKLKGADQYKHVLTESVSNPTPVKLAEEAEALSYEDVELSEALMATHPAPMNELSVPSVALVSEHQATRIPIRLILGAIIGVSIGVILAMLYVGQPKPTKVEASDWKDTNTAIALNDIPPPAKPRKISPQSAVSSKPIAKVAPTAEVTQPSAPTVAAKSVESTARPQETNAQEKQPIVGAMQTSPKPAAKPPPRQKAKKSASRAANPREEPVARKSVVAVAPVNSPKESDSPSAAARAAPASPSPAAAEAAAARPAPAPAPLGPNSVFSFSMVGFQVEGGISKQKSRRTLLKKKREIETCFREVVLANNGPRTGAFMLKLTFGNRGRLRKISVDNKAEAAQSCIKAAIAPLRFPRADTGEAQVRVRVEYSVK